MKEYNLLNEKLQNNTITKLEMERLYQLAFGNEIMNSKFASFFILKLISEWKK